MVAAMAYQLIWYNYAEDWLIITSFEMNIFMSIMFIYMLLHRGNSYGQSLVIAVGKMIGTLMGTLEGYLTMHNVLMAGAGTLCFVADIAYIILLWQTIQKEKTLAIETTTNKSKMKKKNKNFVSFAPSVNKNKKK